MGNSKFFLSKDIRDPSSMYIFLDRTLHCVRKRFTYTIFNPSLYPFATVYFSTRGNRLETRERLSDYWNSTLRNYLSHLTKRSHVWLLNAIGESKIENRCHVALYERLQKSEIWKCVCVRSSGWRRRARSHTQRLRVDNAKEVPSNVACGTTSTNLEINK